MKKFHKWQLALLLPIISLAFASCGGDDEEPDSTGSNDTTNNEIKVYMTFGDMKHCLIN